MSVGNKTSKSSASTDQNSLKKSASGNIDDSISVVRHLGADEDKATFEAKLVKIVKAAAPKK
jgi:hypothetical protein